MDDMTFKNAGKNINDLNLSWVVVGGGEPTVHPKFIEYANELSGSTKFLSIVTNGNWENERISETLIQAFDLVEISVDAGDKNNYENSRRGASWERLFKNLVHLKKIKDACSAKMFIGIRLMVRPSMKPHEKKYIKYWRKYCDTIIAQYLVKPNSNDYSEDIYYSKHEWEDSYPKCSVPFRRLQIRANGDVPLCGVSGSSLQEERRLIIGNINEKSIERLWNSHIMQQYRTAHRKRIPGEMPICKGCRGA
jgi:MoaA/NifB/PqqE/SkfB family radical SAM enzyme